MRLASGTILLLTLGALAFAPSLARADEAEPEEVASGEGACEREEEGERAAINYGNHKSIFGFHGKFYLHVR